MVQPPTVTVPTVPPIAPPLPFQKELDEWLAKAQTYEQEYTKIQADTNAFIRKVEASIVPGKFYGAGSIMDIMIRHQAPAKIKSYQQQVLPKLNKAEFYTRLYGEVPVAISQGIISPDELLGAMGADLTGSLSETELAQVKDIIYTMVQTINKPRVQEITMQPGQLVAPLVSPPSERLPMKTINRMTVDEIMKYLQAGSRPPEVLSKAEWDAYLAESQGYSDADAMALGETGTQAQSIIDAWKEAENERQVARENLAKMPDYKVTDWLRDLALSPVIAMAEITEPYFKHVTRPLAGMLFKNFLPDMQAEYERNLATNTPWMSASQAWDEWQSPNWVLKNILMEGLVDPTTYIGWGLFTKLAKPIPYVGRLVGAAERGLIEVLDIPFDLVKAGIKRLPKTLGQRAYLAEKQAAQNVRAAVERYFKQDVYHISIQDFQKKMPKFISQAISYAQKHPFSETKLALAGREFLVHDVLDEGAVRVWAERLGTKLTFQEITKETVEKVNNIFEDFFMHRLMKEDDSAIMLMKELDVVPAVDKLAIARQLLKERSDYILDSAKGLAGAANLKQALRDVAQRNYQIYLNTEKSMAYVARKQAGAFSTLLTNSGARLQSIWANGIDRIIVKPFAGAYLTFGMYGPMNIVEDYFRSALGRVKPGSMNVDEAAMVSSGLSTDPNLWAPGIAEQLGFLTKRAGSEENWNNWVIQVATLGSKNWADKVYTGLVRLPGAYSMDIRRNFIMKRYMQILSEMGGDTLKKLMEVGPKELPKLSDPKLVKQLERLISYAKTSGDPAIIRQVSGVLVRKKIIRSEVTNILMEHPEISNTIRQHILEQFDVDRLLSEPAAIRQVMNEAGQMLQEEFLRSPELASRQFRNLTEELMKFNPESAEQLANVVLNLNYMSQLYGAFPRQIIAQAAIRSRGLKLAERSAVINADLDRLYGFIDSAGADLDKLVEKVKATMPTVAKPEYTDAYTKLLNNTTAMREYATQFRVRNMEFRRLTFQGRVKADLNNEFWNKFYSSIDDQYRVFNKNMADMQTRQIILSKEADKLGGMAEKAIPPMNITDRLLAPQDIAQLLGGRTDDISRALLDITFISDRDSFISYVRGLAEVGGHKGFSEDAIGQCYDQILRSSKIEPEQLSWLTRQQMELNGVNQSLHDLYQAKLVPESDMVAIRQYVGETATAVEDLVKGPKVTVAKIPDYDIGLGERIVTPELVKEAEIQKIPLPAGVKEGEKVVDQNYVNRIRTELTQAAEGVTNLPYRHPDYSSLESVMQSWFRDGSNYDLQLIGKAASQSPEYLANIRAILKRKYSSGYIRIYRGSGAARHQFLDREFTNVTSSRSTALTFEDSWEWQKGKVVERAKKPQLDNVLVKVDDVVSVGAIEESELIIPVKLLKQRMENPLKAPVRVLPRPVSPEFRDYDTLRQQAMDEAHTWYYKEYVDYSNANAFDAMMKTIYPFYTYESQRWFWLPRSFLQHPGTWTTYQRYMEGTDGTGYVGTPIPGVEWSPVRGTVYGAMNRLSKQQYPEYYDSLGPAGQVVGFLDFWSRFGFYPGAHIGIPMSMFGGLESQTGEVIPALWKTPLNLLKAAFPKNELVKVISDRIFHDRFKDYLTVTETISSGADGVAIWTKLQQKEQLTPEEQAVWDTASRESSLYSALFEQSGALRLRPNEKKEIGDAVDKFIEERYGYTKDQQDWLQTHGYNIWDVVGGMSPTDQAQLEELGYFKYSGSTRMLLPSQQQVEANKIEVAWNDIERYSMNQRQGKLQLESDFLFGKIGPDDFSGGLGELYNQQRAYIDQKEVEVPSLTLEGRKEYYKKNRKTEPVLHPMKELLNLYFSIQLNDKVDEVTGEKYKDWDTFMAQRDIISQLIPDTYKQEWQDYLSKNSTPLEQLRREVSSQYFRKYDGLYDYTLTKYSLDQQSVIKEYYSLKRLGKDLARQEEIRAYTAPSGNKLISDFSSNVSGAKSELRAANPTLDAWLYYWGRTSTFKTSQARVVYDQLLRSTGRKS